MNHIEIINWIQENLIGLIQKINQKLVITYIDPKGIVLDHVCDSLITGVLEINEKELSV
jgi:hypothetical protein